MAFIADYVALHDCTQATKKGQRNSIEPLIRYLKRGHPLTPLLRSWLVELLEERAVGEFRLEYKRRPGYRKSSEGDLIDHLTYERFLELDGKRINRTLSTTTVSMSLTGSCFSSESAPRPFHHGIRRRGGTIFWSALPSIERQDQADMRTHLIHRPARDILPLLGGSRVFSYRV